MGAKDNLSGAQSTYHAELTESEMIMKHATKYSLALVDELGKLKLRRLVLYLCYSHLSSSIVKKVDSTGGLNPLANFCSLVLAMNNSKIPDGEPFEGAQLIFP